MVVRPWFTPSGQLVQRIAEEVRVLLRRTCWIGDASVERDEERLDERSPVAIRRGQRLARLSRSNLGQIRQNLRWRHRGRGQRQRLVREPIDACPERAARADPSQRVVDAFLMRTSDDAIGGHALRDTVLPQETGDVLRDNRSRRTSIASVVHVRVANGSRPARSITETTSFVARLFAGP